LITQAEIETQIAFEREAIAHGLSRLYKNTQELEDKSYASASVYGVASIDSLLPILIKYIEDTTHDRLTRGRGYQFQLIKTYVSKLEVLASATIALKVTLIKYSHTKTKLTKLLMCLML